MMTPEDTKIDLMTLSKGQLARLVAIHSAAFLHLSGMSGAFMEKWIEEGVNADDIATFIRIRDNLLDAVDERQQQTILGTLPKPN